MGEHFVILFAIFSFSFFIFFYFLFIFLFLFFIFLFFVLIGQTSPTAKAALFANQLQKVPPSLWPLAVHKSVILDTVTFSGKSSLAPPTLPHSLRKYLPSPTTSPSHQSFGAEPHLPNGLLPLTKDASNKFSGFIGI
jgi:hypothetical protein